MKVVTTVGELDIDWGEGFGMLTEKKLADAQKALDSACIQFMKEYTPFRSGFLEQSATLGTVIGSGEIIQIAPYAHYMYYGVVYGPNYPIMENKHAIGYFSPPGQAKHPTGEKLEYDTTKHALAGSHWFERMKADKKEELLQIAARAVGGKAE